MKQDSGFTLIELIIVIVILGVLAVTAAPKFIDLSSDAKIASLNAISGTMKSTVTLVQMKARVKGLRPSATNPGGIQNDYVIDFGFGSSEIDFRNLCPESISEGGDRMSFVDIMNIDLGSNMTSRETNQHTLVGYDIPASGTPTTQGCYIIYDSFGSPNCTIEVVDVDC